MIKSPCINICRLDESGLCAGCRRTLNEVASWSRLTDAERDEIMAQLPGRGIEQPETPQQNRAA